MINNKTDHFVWKSNSKVKNIVRDTSSQCQTTNSIPVFVYFQDTNLTRRHKRFLKSFIILHRDFQQQSTTWSLSSTLSSIRVNIRVLASLILSENLHLVDGKSSCRKHVIGKPRKTSKPYDLFNKTEDESIVDNGLNKTKWSSYKTFQLSGEWEFKLIDFH